MSGRNAAVPSVMSVARVRKGESHDGSCIRSQAVHTVAIRFCQSTLWIYSPFFHVSPSLCTVLKK